MPTPTRTDKVMTRSETAKIPSDKKELYTILDEISVKDIDRIYILDTYYGRPIDGLELMKSETMTFNEIYTLTKHDVFGDVNDDFDDNSTKVSLSCSGFITYKISASKDGVGVETEVDAEVDAEAEAEVDAEEQSLWTKWTTWSLWT